jgi:hypothetical protein
LERPAILGVRKVATCAAAIALCLGTSAIPAYSAETYQCEAGPNAAIVTACAARWEAANIRIHIAAETYGGASPSCLNKTAVQLEQFAKESLSTNRARTFSGVWPCGKDPAIGKANDGLLANECPTKAWTYDNRGLPGCTPSEETLDNTMAWLAKNVPLSVLNHESQAAVTYTFSNEDCLVHWSESLVTQDGREIYYYDIPLQGVKDFPGLLSHVF